MDIKNLPQDAKLIIKGATGSGKSTILLERYKYMIEELGIPSNHILILLLNRTQSLDWRKKTILSKSGLIWRSSYYGFIQSEINTYYPLLIKNCEFIKRKRIRPVFLTFESAQYIVSKVIETRREKEGLFSGIASLSDRISIDLTSNLVKAAISDISHEEIGTRLYNSLEMKDKVKKKIFTDLDDVLRAYRNKCVELGILDFGIAVDIYNNYLLKDQAYIDNLLHRVKHIIVDNIEECVPTEVDFIKFLMPNLESCMMAYNYEGGFGSVFGGNHRYMVKELMGTCDVIELKESYTTNKFLQSFSNYIYEKIVNQQEGQQEQKSDDYDNRIEKIAPFELRSEMLEKVGEKIIQLIEKEKYKPSDIVVLSTYADPVTEYVIERIIEKHGYELKNLARKSRILDNQFTKALITLAQLSHHHYAIIPTRDDVLSLIRLILNIDPVRSSILAGQVVNQKPFEGFPEINDPVIIDKIGYYNLEKYNYIKNWIDEYKVGEKLPINEFFQKVFLEILLSVDIPQLHILQAKNLIDSAGNFVEVAKYFKVNPNKGFLDMIRKGIKSSESIFELEEKLTGEFVLLSTPAAYLATSLNCKVIILTSISSENWAPRSIKELTNNHVLTKTWDENMIYTEKMEEKNKLEYMAIILRALFKRCNGKIITFESNLSSGGYENNGILPELI